MSTRATVAHLWRCITLDRHESIVVLIGRWDGVDHFAGALSFMFSTDEAGNLYEYGAKPASHADLKVWRDALVAGYPQYVRDNL